MTILMHYDPFREALSLRNAMDQLFAQSFVRPNWGSSGSAGRGVTMDVLFDGLDEDEIQRQVRQRLREEGFRPEFINRIDEIIVFHQITREQMKDIVDMQINRLRPRLVEHHITMQLSDAAKEALAEMGYDPQFGARPLKRVIQREVENRIARAILDGTIIEGEAVQINVQNGTLVMVTERTQAH